MSAKRWIVAILMATAVSVVVPNPALISTSPGASSDQNGEAIVLKSPARGSRALSRRYRPEATGRSHVAGAPM